MRRVEHKRVRNRAASLAPPTVDAPLGFSINGEAIRPRVKVFYLAGNAPLGRALGVDGFALQRNTDEAEDNFFVRAVAAAEAANLDWLAFTRRVDLGPPCRRDDDEALALEEALQ